MSKVQNRRKEIMFDDGTEAVVYSRRVLGDAKLPTKFLIDLTSCLRLVNVKETKELLLITKWGQKGNIENG